VYRRCGGNPLLVREISQAADPEGLPAGVRDVIRGRLSRLPREAVEVLELAAVAGREVATPVLRHAGGLTPAGLARAVDAAVAAGCVQHAEPGTIRFIHDLFREVLYLDLDSLTRANLHARIADALETLVAPGTAGLAADLARHLVQAAWLGDPAQPLPYLRRAADEAAARLAFEEAAGHLSEGARLASLAGQPATRRAMLLDLADAHRRAGDLNEARAGYLDAADDARRADDARGLARAALGLHAVGSATWTPHTTEIGLLEQALAAHGAAADEGGAAEAPVDDPTVAELLAALAEECVHGSPDPGRARWASERAVAIARREGSPATLGTCLMALHDAVWEPGSAPRRLEILDEAAAIADRAGIPMLAWQACFGRFVALLERADPQAFAELERADRLAADLGDPHLRWVVRSRRAVVALLTGRLPDAEAMIRRVGTDASQLGEPDGRNVVGDLSAQLAAIRGTIDDLRLIWAHGELHPLVMVTIEVQAALERDDPVGAMDRLRPWVEVALTDSLGWQRLGHLALIGRTSAAAGDLGLAARAYQQLLPHAGDLVVTGGAVSVAGPVSLYLGLCAAASGDAEEALAHLEQAVQQAARLDARPWVAWAQAEAAEVRLDRGAGDDRPVAEGLLRAAAATADGIGMAGLARRARVMLAAAAPRYVFRRVDDVWTLGFDGEVVQMPDAKGLRDIARLLATPGVEVPAAALVGEPAGAEATMGADPVLDDAARRSYRRRLDELATAVTAAEAAGDAERSDRLQAEREELVAALSAAYGLGGRSRRLGDGAERARKAVTARIRDTIGRIEQRHPPLGRHLRESIVTGTACCYRPSRDVRWSL
jgi:tetratricopeptide (TPR) repeat protein